MLAGAADLLAAASAVEPPPNTPAEVRWDAGKGTLQLRYHGKVILDATVAAMDAAGTTVSAGVKLEPGEMGDAADKVEQRLRLVPAEPADGVKLVLRGTVTGSEEAFPAETKGAAQKRLPVVRTSVGLSHSLRNDAIYDRRWDWVLTGPADGATRILPKGAGKEGIVFAWESRGPVIELAFRPRFFQKHRGLRYYEPWTYRVWRGSVTGYCTWWPYRTDISQQVVEELTGVFAEKKLPDFGYKYLQLDHGYAQGGGGPKAFLEWDEKKFPGGAEQAIKTIRAAGMQPGLWVHRVYRSYVDKHLPTIGKEHPEWFVTGEDGTPFQAGGYGVWCLNTRNEEAIDNMVRPIFRGLKQQGWDYVKIDGAGDCLYSLRKAPWFFPEGGQTPEESLRKWDSVAREELGPDVFVLTCWGVEPGKKSIGLVDGCRLGGDRFQWNTMLGNRSLNGVVWRGDPDHCDILPERKEERSVMETFGVGAAPVDTIVRPAVVAMAGSMLLVSDKAPAYEDDANLEGMKRSAPVLFTVPGQLYDEGGDGTWWLQEIDRPFDHWSVLARFNWKGKAVGEEEVRFADLGLDPEGEYIVFEFWKQQHLGKHRESFAAPAMEANNGMQVFAIREAREHPWVLSTTRHLSQGGVSLLGLNWDAAGKTLSGRSKVVVGDPYVLTVNVPFGYKPLEAEVADEDVEMDIQTETAAVRFVPSATKEVTWKVTFDRFGIFGE